MNLFSETINSWKDWGRVFQSISAFGPLAEQILRTEKLPPSPIGNLTPGTNAVFRTGRYVLKIFSPAESGFDGKKDMHTEIFAMKFADSVGVNCPEVTAQGVIRDRYEFGYLVMEYIEGVQFSDAVRGMPEKEKKYLAEELRRITDRMNVPCKRFNQIDVIRDSNRNGCWDPFPDPFKQERMTYVRDYDWGESVFVHGDINGDNLILGKDGKLYIIDFADALLAPKVYEEALIAAELFDFDRTLLRGYFGDYRREKLARLCLDGLLLHPFGGDIVKQHVGNISELQGVEELYLKIKERL